MKDKERNLKYHKCKNCDYYANRQCVWYSHKVDKDGWCKIILNIGSQFKNIGIKILK